MGKKTIKVAFILDINKNWMGGVNYFINLLWLIRTKIPEIEIYAFISPKLDQNLKEEIWEYAHHVINVNFLRSKTFSWFLYKICNKFFIKNFLAEKELKKYYIDIVSHTGCILKNIKTIGWIPDFQHIHLPEMFSKKEIKDRSYYFTRLIKKTAGTIVSSHDAYLDCSYFAPALLSKIYIFHFVSKINNTQTDINFFKHHNIRKLFFFLPNQLWKHKNHVVVIKAVKILKNQGINVQIVCSGNMNDYRHSKYKNYIINLINTNSLQANILLLGLIPYKHVATLLKYSYAVINPSLFEGWSTTVEECKSIGKPMILSDINVHKEQYPEAFFFNRSDPMALAETIKKTLNMPPKQVMYNYKKDVERAIDEYRNIIYQVSQGEE